MSIHEVVAQLQLRINEKSFSSTISNSPYRSELVLTPLQQACPATCPAVFEDTSDKLGPSHHPRRLATRRRERPRAGVLLALNGLRISEAPGADVEHLGVERGHRTLIISHKGGKIVTIPAFSSTARAADLCVRERDEAPIFVDRDGDRRPTGTLPLG